MADTIQQQVAAQFEALVEALNRKDTAAWSAFYSQEAFVSAIAGTDHFATRAAWVETIGGYFAQRVSQRVEPVNVRVTALADDLALLTSGETTEMALPSGEQVRSQHAFTMLWRPETDGWKIIHSHESWLDE